MRSTLVVLGLLAGACGDDDVVVPDAPIGSIDAAPDSGATADAPVPVPDATPADATPCVGFGGEVREDMPGTPYADLPPNPDVTMTALVDGVQVDQTQTNEAGSFFLCVPPDTDVAILVEKTGFASYAFLKHTSPDGLYLAVRHFHESFADFFWNGIGGDFPSATTGFITVNTFGPDMFPDYQEGVSITVMPAPGGIVYFDAAFNPDPKLTATSSAAFVAVYNVQPGVVNVSASHPMLTDCHHVQTGAFASPQAGTLRIPVFNNTETVVDFLCE